ncbi:MAG: DUF3987 domain-containing protein [Streptosporangiaceae bacterium]
MTGDLPASAPARITPLPAGLFLRPELPDAALYGLPGDVVRVLAETTEADPAALLLTFLTMFGSAVGPEPHVEFGGRPQCGRLFTLIVGDAASGRKGTAHGAVEDLFRKADPDWADRIEPGLQSAEAMIDRVADCESDDCRLLVVETEYNRLLAAMASSGGKLSAQLRNAYDGSRLAVTRRDRKRSAVATRAHISLLAHITPEELLRVHSRARQAGGLESRMLYAYVTRARELSPFAASSVPSRLVPRISEGLERSRGGVLSLADPISRELCMMRGIQPSTVLPVAPQVLDGWPALMRDLPAVDRGLGAMFDRAETHVMRLAIVYALTDQASAVGTEHVRAAVALWSYCARSAEIIFAVPLSSLPPALNPRRMAKLWNALHQTYPGWLALGQIQDDVFNGNVAGAEIAAMITFLAERGQIEMRQVPTGGRPRTEYKLADPAGTFPVTP